MKIRSSPAKRANTPAKLEPLLTEMESVLTSASPDVFRLRHQLERRLLLTEEQARVALYTIVKGLSDAFFPPVSEVELIVTQRCNLACAYCFEGNVPRVKDMNVRVARAAIDLLINYSKDTKGVSILFFGGEPFLNFPVIKWATAYAEDEAKANHKEISFRTTSNLTILTDDMLHFIEQHHIKVLASVDGLQETHDRCRVDRRGHGTFSRVIKNLQRLKEAQGFVGVKMTVMPCNVRRLYEDVRGLIGLGATTFVIGHATGVPWSEQEKKDFWQQLHKVRLWQEGASAQDMCVLGEGDEKVQPEQFGCQAGRTTICVAPDGEVSPCSKVFALDSRRTVAKLGDVFHGLTHFRNRFNLVTCERLISACRGLGIDRSYYGGCLADNLRDTGELYKPSMEEHSFRVTARSVAAS